MSLYFDNKSMIYIAHNDVSNKHTKHIEIYCHFVCQHVKSHTNDLKSISDQPADFFTKSQYVIKELAV